MKPGQVIMADFQGEGRGQRGTKWLSDTGKNLLISVYLEFDNLSAVNQSALMQYSALSICQALQSMGIPAQIKWPNDILVHGKKICGVLIENQLHGSKIKNSVIGIGLNVNQDDFSDLKATSIKNELKAEQNRMEILGNLLQYFNQLIDVLLIDLQNIKSPYLNNLYKYKTPSKFQNSTLGQFEAQIIDVNENGKLVLSYKNEILEFDLKEIIFLD